MRSLFSSAPPGPCAAEAARTLVETASTVALHLDALPGLVTVGGHAAGADGALLVPTSADCRVLAATRSAGELRASAVVSDVAPLPVRDRVRGRAVLTGTLAELPADAAAAAWHAATADATLPPDRRLMRLRPRTVVLTLAADPPVDVCPAAYATTRPDPLAPHEAQVLSHLTTGHPDEVARLAGLLPRRVRAGATRVVPVRLDRHALVLRVEHSDRWVDVPVALASSRATSPGEVLAALRAVLDTRAPADGRRPG